MWEKGAFRKSLNVIVFNNNRTHSKPTAKILYFFSLYKTRLKIIYSGLSVTIYRQVYFKPLFLITT